MDNYLALVNALVGQIMPILTEFLNSKVPDSRVRFLVAMVISVILGGVTTFLGGKFDAQNILASVAVVFVSGQAAYNLWFKKSELEFKINQKME